MNKVFQNIIKCLFVIIFISILINCNKPKEDKEVTITKKQYLPDKNEVDIMVLDKSIFKKELVSNGRLVALEKSTLKFNVSEKLNNIHVKDGDYVKKGQLLASLDAFTYQQKVSKAERSEERRVGKECRSRRTP